jgi:hypothetical protein
MMDLDPEARRILELTREARTPSARDKARVDRLVGAALALGSATSHAASGGAATKVVGTAAAIKWTGIALLAIGGAGYVGWKAAHRSPPPAPVVAVAPAAVPPEAPAPIGQTMAAAEPEPAAPAALEPSEEPSSLRAGAAPRSSHAKAAEGTLPEELDLLHDAQAKWRAGNAAAALSLLSEHRKRFPRSQLASERDALTVLSLCATNRTAEARKLARRFLQTAQRSPLRTSVEESCGGR